MGRGALRSTTGKGHHMMNMLDLVAGPSPGSREGEGGHVAHVPGAFLDLGWWQVRSYGVFVALALLLGRW